MAETLDHQLRRFISQHISSVEQLEILLLLAAEESKTWSVDEVFAVIQSNRQSIEARLKGMVETGFLELKEASRFRYKPTNEERAASVRALEIAYKQSRVKVIEAIFSPIDPAKTFADSFRIKKEK